MTVIGIDVGGTTIKAIRWDGRSPDEVAAEARRPTPRENPEHVLDTIVELVAELRTPDVRAVGLAIPGIIDEPNGVAVLAAAFGWENLPIRAKLEATTGLPVALGHDVRSAGRAELEFGASRGAADSLLVALGTGIGSAIVSGGRLLVGAGYAGQLGHIVIEPDGVPCGCGQRGCLSRLASAGAVLQMYNARTTGTPATGADQVAERARDGDPVAVAVWDEAVESLTTGLVIAVALLGPEVVVLGGGLAMAGDQLIAPVTERLAERLTFHRMPRLAQARFGEAAGRLGAALLAKDLLAHG